MVNMEGLGYTEAQIFIIIQTPSITILLAGLWLL